MKKWRLGLDLGTNSIGWCALQLGSSGPESIIDMGVRIFPDGREPAAEGRIGDSLAVKRRIAKGMRRRRDRYSQQRKKLINLMIEARLVPSAPTEQERMKLLDPYLCRTEALNRKLDPVELARALVHLSVRRGFKSNRKKDKGDIKELSKNLEKISYFREELTKSGSRTIGEYLYNRKRNGEAIRFRPHESAFYPERSMYLQEFHKIKEKQNKYYGKLDWDKVEDLIFYQRPLKAPPKGKCQFYTTKERAYKALPITQRFRILQDINNLMKIDDYGGKIGLTPAEKQILFDKLNSFKTVSFNSIRRTLKVENTFNLEERESKGLKGNSIDSVFLNEECFGPAWHTIPIQEQDELVELLIQEDNEEEIRKHLEKYALSERQIDSILNLTFPSGTASLSKEFMYDCAEIMYKEWLPYHEAVQKMGLHHSVKQSKQLLNGLPYYGEVLEGSCSGGKPEAQTDNPEVKFGKIGNPTVHVALNQLRRLINSLIGRWGNPTEIVIELSREFKQSREDKLKTYKKNKKNREENERIRKELIHLKCPHPSAWDIKKFKLWEELGEGSISRPCIYCGVNISPRQLLSPTIEIEHILPFSKTLMNSLGNLTIAHKKCNAIKGNRTPYEAFASNPDGFNYPEILQRASLLGKTKRNKFLKDALEQYNKERGFIERQLTDNAYLSRKAKEYLSVICPEQKIWTIKGGQTAILRAKWGLNTLLNSTGYTWHKNRTDHRHHSLDALVIGLTDRSLLQKISSLNARGFPQNLLIPEFPFKRCVIHEQLKNMIISIKPDHGKAGQLFNETAYGLRYRIEPLSWKQIIEQVLSDNICSAYWKDRYKQLVAEKGATVANKQIVSNWSARKKGNAGLMCLVPHWVSRKPLAELNKTELSRIWDLQLKKLIAAEIPAESLKSKALKSKLEAFGKKHNIKRVRFIADNTQNCIRIESVLNKGYLPRDYLYVLVWAIPPHRRKQRWEYRGYFVNRVEANSTGFIAPKPHPAAKCVAQLFKNDVLQITTPQDEMVLARIASFSTTNNRIDIQPVFSADSIEKWLEQTDRSLCNSFWKPQAGQNFISINVLWSQNKAVQRVRVSPDGRIIKAGN